MMTAPVTVEVGPPSEVLIRRARSGRVLGDALARLTVVVAVVMTLELATRRAASPFFPPPSAVWAWARTHWLDGPAYRVFVSQALLDVLAPSLRRLGLAYAFAVFAAIVAGTAIAISVTLRNLFYPLVHFLRAIPTAAAVPMIVVMFGIGENAKICIMTLAVGLTLVVSVVDGIGSVDAVLIDTASIYHVAGWRRVVAILLPGALPRIFAGLRVSTTVALVALVLAELTGATDGIGFLIIYAQRNFLLKQMWAAIALLGVLGLTMNLLLTLVERRLLSWHQLRREPT
ncbi:MAG: hypothetical protein QOD72_199 [Acidimicrobiaceae bacterium]|jgi:ABC-type nitrate/sulfonate/bicarbonate transport system permease component|nr:hypothetical protein [Acidimicrobiaceae bacterium]